MASLRTLQVHFSTSALVFRGELETVVLHAIRALLFSSSAVDNPYMRAKVDILPDESIRGGIDRLVAEVPEEVSACRLDYAVRSLLEALEARGDAADTGRLVHQLQPVWEVYLSDYLLRWWRGDR